MLLHVPGILLPEQVSRARALLDQAEWIDGRATAGHQSSRAKQNMQVRENTPVAKELGDMVVKALERNALFITAALPSRVFPPLFNRYRGGESFGTHVDNAIRQISGTPLRMRTDLSATLFLNDPESYDGGELVVEDLFGVHRVKLPAGHLILYPATSLHHVTPVTRGERLASFFWIQSMVKDDADRTLLFDLDMATQQVGRDLPDHPARVQLTNIYHNLLRRWAEL
ncbi:MAG TPA: Fe2+-dependent dioxygenase [Terriglobia bacterium]|nr:Fe2+-dependent dioxygenase [Terriglobia bacterium]